LNQGFATEAAIACRQFAFNTANVRRVVSLIDPANIASTRVAEKVGMTCEKEIQRWGKRISLYAIDLE
jgi:RimJ/RimL family protein N-acetyltransferase